MCRITTHRWVCGKLGSIHNSRFAVFRYRANFAYMYYLILILSLFVFGLLIIFSHILKTSEFHQKRFWNEFNVCISALKFWHLNTDQWFFGKQRLERSKVVSKLYLPKTGACIGWLASNSIWKSLRMIKICENYLSFKFPIHRMKKARPFLHSMNKQAYCSNAAPIRKSIR